MKVSGPGIFIDCLAWWLVCESDELLAMAKVIGGQGISVYTRNRGDVGNIA